jgi:Domain of unknown function (DUF4349)
MRNRWGAAAVLLALPGSSCAFMHAGAPAASPPPASAAPSATADETGRSSAREEEAEPAPSASGPTIAAAFKSADATGGVPPNGAAKGRAASTAERFVVTGEIALVTPDVIGVVAAIRARVFAEGGSIASERLNGDPEHRQATLQLRIPPTATSLFLDWLGTQATVDSRHFESSDVTRQWFDRDLAIKNLGITMSRLQDLANRPNADLAQIIEIEREMTRVRGEIEELEGAQRLLDDQVARATLTVEISTKPGIHPEPELKFELVPHLTLMRLADPGTRSGRGGAGVTMMFSRWFSLDFEILPQKDLQPRSYFFTAATGLYSDFLGGGERRFFNPYIGFRLGTAKLDGYGAFTYGADIGLELVRFRLFLVEIQGRAMGLWYDRSSSPTSDIVLEGILGVGVPF